MRTICSSAPTSSTKRWTTPWTATPSPITDGAVLAAMNVADKYCKERLVSDNLRAQLKQALDENARLAKEMSEMKREARKATKEKAKAKREAKAEAKAESEAKAEDAQPAPAETQEAQTEEST